ncbi:MAG: DMT family transporter [Mesorhizobium sp.]|nr:DMT family transporter [Mesorhizobium sp.]
MFSTGLLFSLLDASAKYLVLSGMSAPYIVWVRFAVHVVLVLLLFRSWSNRDLFKARNMPLQILRGIFLFGSTIFNFVALLTLQMAEAMTIFFFAPMVITALAGPLLGEWAGWRRWAAIGVGFIGILVVTRPGLGSFGIGHVYALFSMLSYCLYVIMTRHMGATETSASLIFYSALTPVILMSPAVPLAATIPPDLLHGFVLVSLGFYGALGHWLLIKAYKLAPASALAPYPYLQLVWAVAFGYLIFGEIPDRYTLLGAAIIIASGLYIVQRERRLRLASLSEPHAEDADLAKKL